MAVPHLSYSPRGQGLGCQPSRRARPWMISPQTMKGHTTPHPTQPVRRQGQQVADGSLSTGVTDDGPTRGHVQ